jgi:drug/metabolite transporter (DMT)-like permease
VTVSSSDEAVRTQPGAASVQLLPPRRALDLRASALVLLLCVIWGIQQVAIKFVASDVPPVTQLAVRFGGAAIVFGLWVGVHEGRRAFMDGTLTSGLFLGLMFTLEFALAGTALLYTTAAHTTVFLYSAPIFTALGLQFLPDERLDGRQWAGICAAFAGIVVAFVGPGERPGAQVVFGDFLALLGGAAWGFSNVVLRRGRVGGAATAKTVLYQVGVAAMGLSLLASITGQARLTLSEPAILALLFQTLIISILSYVIWFWLLRHYLTSRLMLLSLMTPLFGVLFGALLLRDQIEPRFAVGSLLVLGGILIVNGRLLRKRVA